MNIKVYTFYKPSQQTVSNYLGMFTNTLSVTEDFGGAELSDAQRAGGVISVHVCEGVSGEDLHHEAVG